MSVLGGQGGVLSVISKGQSHFPVSCCKLNLWKHSRDGSPRQYHICSNHTGRGRVWGFSASALEPQGILVLGSSLHLENLYPPSFYLLNTSTQPVTKANPTICTLEHLTIAHQVPSLVAITLLTSQPTTRILPGPAYKHLCIGVFVPISSPHFILRVPTFSFLYPWILSTIRCLFYCNLGI